MEVFSIGFILIAYVLVRLLLGHHHTNTMRDRKIYKTYIKQVANKEYRSTLAKIDKILSIKPKSAICWALKAECHLGLGEYYQAILYADKALHLDYTLSELYFHKGIAYLHLNQITQALIEFDKTIWHTRDQHAVAYYHKGLVLLSFQEYDKAILAFERSAKLGNEQANYELLCLRNQKQIV